MEIRQHKTLARSIDTLLNERPDQTIILRCIDCQTFLLPEEVGTLVLRFRLNGERQARPFQYCPVCYPQGAPKPETLEAIEHSEFIVLTRHQYEKTKVAEKWGLTYDPKTDKTNSNLILPATLN